MAAQFTARKGPRALRLLQWMTRAITSLPVPVSPDKQIVASVSATCATCCKRTCILELRATTFSNPYSSFTNNLSRLISRLIRCWPRAFSI